ncbi:hypothetical protein Tco_0622972 [Tanacetum coccineum]
MVEYFYCQLRMRDLNLLLILSDSIPEEFWWNPRGSLSSDNPLGMRVTWNSKVYPSIICLDEEYLLKQRLECKKSLKEINVMQKESMILRMPQDIGRSRFVMLKNEERKKKGKLIKAKEFQEKITKKKKMLNKDVEEMRDSSPTSTRSLLTFKASSRFGIPEAEKGLDTTCSGMNRWARKILALRRQDEEEEHWCYIQALYEKVKRFEESFTAVGSTEDERNIKEMNEKRRSKKMNEGVKDPDQKSLKKRVVEETPKKEDTAKVPAKVDMIEQGTKKRKGGHMKMLSRKKKRPQSDVNSDDEHRKCLKIVTFEGTMDSEITERKSVIARLNKVSSPDGDYLVIYRANGNFREFNCLLEVLHIFDRQDLFHLYDLVMEQYSEIILEGIELILWGDLKIMMESSQEENDQKLKDGTVIHMLVERRYHLSKDLLQRILDLGLEVERESTAALDLIRFIKQQIGEE